MSDDVRRVVRIGAQSRVVDPLVAAEIERLRAEVAQHEKWHLEEQERHGGEVERLKTRIEELEQERSLIMGGKLKTYYCIHRDKIDAAVEFANECRERGEENAWFTLNECGIIECEECGGSGDSRQTPKNPPYIDQCETCHGHRWVKD